MRITGIDLILDDRIETDTSCSFQDGTIRAIGADALPGEAEFDGEGGLLAPGIVDLHCDAIEKIVESRPGVMMPLPHVMPQAERLNAGCGITTIYHSISYAENEFGVRSLQMAEKIAEDIHGWRPHGVIDHRLHCRYEVSDPNGLDVVRGLIDSGAAQMISVMDHSPGQGQFQTFERFFAYYGKAYNMTEAEVKALADNKKRGSEAGWERAVALIKHAVDAKLAVASHDDDCQERIDLLAGLGGTISEFPVNLPTVSAAHEAGLSTVLGAPNIVRGGSQSGNMRALDAVLDGCLDCLCADYVPWTMAAAACALPGQSDLELPTAWAMVSANPAKAAGLHDRGRIAEGLRADCCLLAKVRGLPQVVATWAGGRLAHRSELPQASAWRSDHTDLAISASS